MLKVLLVDDEELERTYLKNFFAENPISSEFKVIGEAVSSREAIHLSQQFNPDIIFMDIQMPGIDGLEATQKIKSLNPKVKCIILTAYDYFIFAQKALRAGADEYLLKPVMADEILSILMQIKQKNKLNSTNLFDNIQTHQKEFLNIKYPYEKELLLIRSLEVGDTKMLNNCFQEYLESLFDTTEIIMLIKVRLHELNTVMSRILINCGYDQELVTELLVGFPQALLYIDSKDELIKFVDSYKIKIFHLMSNNNKVLGNRVIEYIKVNYDKDISINVIAQHFHFSPSYISRLIKRETGISYSEYINQIRLHHAKLFLKNSSLKIQSIANQVGYNDVSNFNRVFKKCVGIAPSKYRNIFNESN
ncbi:response regulator transcription factor [Desulfitibacter alkalitolerans]|uniref:response regulator transcription factor n=1 Tax=Desulfitibacter alkalitolerans TaxID=264641 RepID=UPI0004864CF1|nr:response regulator [Desulfitibacter alkalitolerans]